ncbi:DUF6204 family protein [Actinoplanes sp. TFC3]|uniref:DUF6204 family protein n=1 Tax=Actinoplanes sp. TFC3 TaxID=1710355 RepID=UPI00082CE010|nr:DUF6204 family protein [Actinoplanes sp. TFC3]
MSSRTIRVTVRGAFDALSPAHREALLADAAAHDVSFAAFTEQGSMTYDIAARPFFTFRYQGTVDDEKDIPRVVAEAEGAAAQWLDARGLGYKNVTSQATDMSQVPLGARGKRRQS